MIIRGLNEVEEESEEEFRLLQCDNNIINKPTAFFTGSVGDLCLSTIFYWVNATLTP